MSHSLGARVVLQAIANLTAPARLVCLTAAAVNQGCFSEEYARSAKKAQSFTALASHRDQVLKLAYPPGDLASDTLIHDHPYFESALGYDGPPSTAPQPIARPWQIADGENYDHGDYHAPGDPPPVPAGGKWIAVADFMLRAYRGLPQTWPTG